MAMKGFETICIDDRLDDKRYGNAHVPPIFATSTFVYDSPEKAMEVFKGNEEAYIYGRWHNPGFSLVEKKIALLEAYNTNLSASAIMFSSGMAAISGLIMSLGLQPGDTILTQGNLYGTTTELLDVVMMQQQVDVIYADMSDLNGIEELLNKHKNIRLLYLETPANPTLACYDLDKLAELAKKYGIKSAADNTFGTPYLQQPLKHGIDFVVHSTTKFLNGHGNAIGGIVVGTDTEHMNKKVWQMRKLLGGVPSPFDAFLLNNGLKTLVLRMRKHCLNALQVATWLEDHPKIERVNYPGLLSHPYHWVASKQMTQFGGLLSFELKGGLKAGIALMDNVKQCILTASLGTADTLIQHPASMTHIKVPKQQREVFGITDGLIRLSVGLEDVEDIINDLEQALEAC